MREHNCRPVKRGGVYFPGLGVTLRYEAVASSKCTRCGRVRYRALCTGIHKWRYEDGAWTAPPCVAGAT